MRPHLEAAATANALRRRRYSTEKRVYMAVTVAPAAAATATDDIVLGVEGRELERRGVVRR